MLNLMRNQSNVIDEKASFNILLFIRCPEAKFLRTKFEFGGSFGMSLEGDCHRVEVTPNLELSVTFGMSLERVCHELYT
jgi:hypothetical protein